MLSDIFQSGAMWYHQHGHFCVRHVANGSPSGTSWWCAHHHIFRFIAFFSFSAFFFQTIFFSSEGGNCQTELTFVLLWYPFLRFHFFLFFNMIVSGLFLFPSFDSPFCSMFFFSNSFKHQSSSKVAFSDNKAQDIKHLIYKKSSLIHCMAQCQLVTKKSIKERHLSNSQQHSSEQ